MSDFELVTLIIAVWGAALSTILATHTIFKDRRSVKVIYGLAITDDNFGRPITLVLVEAINKGHRPVTITNVGLTISDGRYYIQPYNSVVPVNLPARLLDGESISIYLDLEKIRERGLEQAQQGIRITGAYVKDAEGKIYTKKISKKESDYLAKK